jgi:hypothetical protein
MTGRGRRGARAGRDAGVRANSTSAYVLGSCALSFAEENQGEET